MKNITLAVDADVLDRVRRHAAQVGTSVNAIVREHLARVARDSDAERKDRAHRRLMELIDGSTAEVGPITWTRDDIHDRR